MASLVSAAVQREIPAQGTSDGKQGLGLKREEDRRTLLGMRRADLDIGFLWDRSSFRLGPPVSVEEAEVVSLLRSIGNERDLS